MRHFHRTCEGQEDLVCKFVNAGAPLFVKPVDRFISDLRALVKVFSVEVPPVIVLWLLSMFAVICGFREARGKGFGSTLSEDGGISCCTDACTRQTMRTHDGCCDGFRSTDPPSSDC